MRTRHSNAQNGTAASLDAYLRERRNLMERALVAALPSPHACPAELGLAFQIVDDILDVEGATADLGKTAGKDVASGKPTYPALYGVEASRRLAADCLGRAEGILRDVAIADPHLLAIGRWIVERSN